MALPSFLWGGDAYTWTHTHTHTHTWTHTHTHTHIYIYIYIKWKFCLASYLLYIYIYIFPVILIMCGFKYISYASLSFFSLSVCPQTLLRGLFLHWDVIISFISHLKTPCHFTFVLRNWVSFQFVIATPVTDLVLLDKIKRKCDILKC